MLYDIILPLAIEGTLTYDIPDTPKDIIGRRVIVPIGKNKLISGVVLRPHSTDETESFSVKTIISILDERPIITPSQLALWQWMATYYMCPIGDVMRAALPNTLRLESETKIRLNPDKTAEKESLTETQIKVMDILSDGKIREIDELSKLIGVKNVVSAIQPLIDDEYILSGEYVKEKLKVKSQQWNRLTITPTENKEHPLNPLSEEQRAALQQVNQSFTDKDVVLLHGVTGSGKTEVYTHLIEQTLQAGKQVLYMVPEIALTTQLTDRLEKVFGDTLGVYHSKLSDFERADLYQHLLKTNRYRLIVGVRSAVFLPLHDLGLVIVDEEHDSSYKQQEPAPRYNGRDTAIWLAHQFGAKVLLGTATPSVETYYRTQTGKFGLVELFCRYQGVLLPQIHIVNSREAYRKKEMKGHLSYEITNRISDEIGKNKQVIIFQNRRGYAPYIECSGCAYIPKCINCDVSMTLHKRQGILSCHYCGYTISIPQKCPACGMPTLTDKGVGTEKIEDEISELFPKSRIGRMDLDSTRKKDGHQKIINSFANHQIDILIGTQMVTKGLDFSDVSTVVVLNADQVLNSPDFRGNEQGYQMLEQVSGRAGRKQEQGHVYIQTGNTENPVISQVCRHDYSAMYRQQIEERQMFRYPPFYRLIIVHIAHRDPAKISTIAQQIQDSLHTVFTHRCSRVVTPLVTRVKLLYHRQIMLKFAQNEPMNMAKEMLQKQIILLAKDNPDIRSARIYFDVDPL